IKATELATFGEGHPLWKSKSNAHWLLMIEGAQQLDADLEDVLLDLAFDGCSALPANTLIAVHFASDTTLSDALDDPAVPITVLKKSHSEMLEDLAASRGLSFISLPI